MLKGFYKKIYIKKHIIEFGGFSMHYTCHCGKKLTIENHEGKPMCIGCQKGKQATYEVVYALTDGNTNKTSVVIASDEEAAVETVKNLLELDEITVISVTKK